MQVKLSAVKAFLGHFPRNCRLPIHMQLLLRVDDRNQQLVEDSVL